MTYQPVIGIEVHCELKTKTKMFSSSLINFSSAPNTNVSAIDIAFPGTLPRVNKKAVEYAILTCKALNMKIDKKIVFDRKNYFYPDLPKGYQITQDSNPIGKDGFIEIGINNKNYKKIRINRLHMEEDTAKQLHFEDYTLIDYNRAGIPLIEIVSEPDLRSSKEACEYIENLRLTLLYLGVSDVKMEEGSMRCDINVSVMPKGSCVLGTRTEIKNLNSIANIEKAIDYEIKRQIDIIKKGGKVVQETRRFDEKNQTTVLMRKKNDALNYKYFREPNLAPIYLQDDYINSILKNIPTLPVERKKNYLKTYKLTLNDANNILANKDVSDYFQECVDLLNEPILISNWILGEIFAYLNANNLTIHNNPITPTKLTNLIKNQINKSISSKQAKRVFEILLIENKSVEEIIENEGLKQISDDLFILELIKKVLDSNNDLIISYHQGKTNVLGFLVGQVMKLSKGQANPALTKDLLEKEINKK